MNRGPVVVIIIVVVGLGLAVVIPSFLRWRLSNPGESPPIGDTRTVISAMEAYRFSNGGFYEGRLQCLGEPSACIPGYAANGPTFLDPMLVSLDPKGGYKRSFHPGPPADAAEIAKAKASSTSVLSYAYVAVPVEVGKTGIRAFCGDSNGIVCFTKDGAMPKIEGGTCPLSVCQVLQ
jgi:hypothetical protein